jgi:hypothetical protein
MGRCFWFLWSVCALWLNGDLAARRREKTQKGRWSLGWWSFGGIEDFLTTRVTKEHKDGHVFLVFVVCVCFVVERRFSRKEAQENAKRKMEFGMADFRSDFCCLISAVCFQDFLFSTS